MFAILAVAVLVGLLTPRTITGNKSEALAPQYNPLDVLSGTSSKEQIIEAIRYVSDKYGTDFDCYNAIIKAESGYINRCNFEYGCGAGQGLIQLIPSTARYCSKKLGRKISPTNLVDSLECGAWLIKNEGTYHWGTANTWWGSYWKWKDYCK